MRAKPFHILSFFLFLFLASCGEKTEILDTEKITDYAPYAAGKYFTYRLDSTVFTQAGRAQEIHSYQEKHVIDALLSDNLGRPSYRVYRYLRDTLGANGWTSAGTYWITPTATSLEVVENNIRSIRLNLPIKEGMTWKGNNHAPFDMFSDIYGYDWSNDDDIQDWDFTYQDMDATVQLGSKTYQNVITVQGVDESSNVPVTIPSSYGYINYGRDQYAKGIGLIFQQLIMWEYQPNPSSTPYREGFEIKRILIDHN
jgi:hypothetical protein